MFAFLGQPNSSEWIPVASLPRWASIPLLFCPFHRFSPSFSRLFRSHCPVLHDFHPQVRHSLFGNLVAQFVGFWGELSIVWVGTPGAILPVERVGHCDPSRSEARLLSIQPSGNGTGPARTVSKSEYQWSLPSRWEAVGAHCGTTAQWMPQRSSGEHGVNPTLVMPIG